MLLSRLGTSATAARVSATASMCSAPLELPIVRSAQLGPERNGNVKRPSSTSAFVASAAASSAFVASAASSSSPTLVTLKVEGMVCSKCTDRVENVLMSMEGVKDARADLGTGEVKVEVESEGKKETSAAAAKLAAAVEELGFGAAVA